MATKVLDLTIEKDYWVTTIANINSPTVAELNAGKDLTCLLTPAYLVDFADSDTVGPERAMCENANTVTATVANYEGNLTVFRSFATGNPDASDLVSIFPPGTFGFGFFVRRQGLPTATAWAAAQKVDIFKFQYDMPKLKGGTNEGYLKGSIKLLPQGIYAVQATVAA